MRGLSERLCVGPTFQKHRDQRRAVAVLRLLHEQLPVVQDRGHRVAPSDDVVHDVAGVVLLVGAKCLDREESVRARVESL